jgi:hypothetical protein
MKCYLNFSLTTIYILIKQIWRRRTIIAKGEESWESPNCELIWEIPIQRDERAQKLRLTRARFPVIKTLDSFEFSAIPTVNKPWCWNRLGVALSKNVIFIGIWYRQDPSALRVF